MKSVVAGAEHVVALDQNGRVWSWGDNLYGQLGVRVQRKSTLPGRVKDLSRVTSVGAGSGHSVALKQDGTVWLWGNMGIPVPQDQLGPIPRRVEGLDNIVAISSGHRNHVLALRADGIVIAFGANDLGQLGNGTRTASTTGVLVPGLTNVVGISAGSTISMALKANGEVWFWGQSGGSPADPGFTTPQKLLGLPGPAKKISATFSGFVVLQDGTVWRFTEDYVPRAIAGLSGIAEVTAEDAFTILARAQDGRLYTMTDNQLGEAGIGNTTNLQRALTLVPNLENVTTMSIGRHHVVAVTQDGKLWTWGRNSSGSLGLGETIGYSAPLRVDGLPANIQEIATGLWNSMARTATGDVWAWGSNANTEFGNDSRTPRSTPFKLSITGVTQISVGDSLALYLKGNGEVWWSGVVAGDNNGGGIPTLKSGLPSARYVAAGLHTAYAVDQNGALWAWGENTSGQVGDASLGFAVSTPQRINGITGKVTQVVAAGSYTMVLTEDGRVWAWGSNSSGSLGDGTTIDNRTPTRIAALSNVVEIAPGFARRADGTLFSWGAGTQLSRAGDFSIPARVEGIDSVARIAVGYGVSVAMRVDGTVWAWGQNCESACSSVGDGTFIPRNRPVLVVAQDGRGSIDNNDWFLDLKPGTPKAIPAASIPKLVAVARSLSNTSLLNYDASVNVRQADVSKTLGLYVVGLVPPAFLSQVTAAPGAHAMVAGMKADTYVVVNLTSAGWTVAAGQLSAYASGVTNGALAASNLLVNVNPATIPGARFCIGYGESASDMLKTETIRDFLSLAGAPASAVGLPCLLSGVYVDGPPTSQQGKAVPIRAVVVGQSPTGKVRFKERYSEISSDITIGAVNAGVSDASFSFTPAAAGEFAFGAAYTGDVQNAAATSELPLRHVVSVVQANTATRIDAPVSSEIGTELRLVAQVSGSRPGGTVQFHRDGTHVGAPVPVIADQAALAVVGLGIGQFTFTATYSGDSANQPSTSPVFLHRVIDIATSVASLASAANPVPLGDVVTLTATVSGTSPSGTVTLREGAVTVGTPVSLVEGRATFVLQNLGAGLHVFTVDYPGDASNTSATSNALFQQVTLPAELPVTVTVTGSGQGTVTVSGSASACNATCTSQHRAGSSVTLTATPASGSALVAWSGACTGTGTCNLVVETSKAITATFNLSGLANGLTLSAPSLDFGGQSMSTTAPAQTMTLTNGGTVTVNVSSIVVAPPFTLRHNCGALAPGSSCTVTVTYTPGTEGSVNGAIVISSNAGSQAIPVSGTGEKSLVTHYYRSILRRAPDAAGKAYWQGEAARLQGMAVNVNETWFAMAGSFYSSAEYQALGRDNIGFMTDLFNTFFNRAPDPAGLAYWADLLSRGMPRDVVLVSFMFSGEFAGFTQAIFGNTQARKEVDTVVDFFRGLLSRLPDNGGFDYWLQRFRTAQCAGEATVRAEVESISSQFIQSGEYLGRNRTNTEYVGDLYNAFLRRGGDLEGVQFWIGEIANSRRTRENVRQQFVASPEFSTRINAVIAQGCLR